MNVIDLVARKPDRLLQLIDGPHVELAGGDISRTVGDKGLTIERLDPGWLIRLLSVITNPNVAFISAEVGIYGLIFELSTQAPSHPASWHDLSAARPLCPHMLPINYNRPGLVAVGMPS